MDGLYNIFTNFNSIVVLLTVFCATFYWYFSVPRNIPPGPLGLPIIGSLPLLRTSFPAKTLQKLSENYGPVLSFYVGNKLVIVLNSYEAIKEAFVMQADVFSGRPLTYHYNIAQPEKYSVLTSDGPIWKAQRRFALNVLKELGVGKLSIEPLIMEEIQHFLKELESFEGKETDFRELLTLSLSNVMCILLFGGRYAYNDQEFINLKRFHDAQSAASSAVTIFEFMPWLRHIPGISNLVKKKSYMKSLKKNREFIHTLISNKRKIGIDGHWDNFTNAYIEEQKTRKEKGIYDETFSDVALEQNIRALFGAGSKTTAGTLHWTILLMMLHPDVQTKVQREIDRVYGSGQLPSWNDRNKTPYAEAVIQEIQRVTTLAPLSVPHRNTEDCKVMGHRIPKNSYIFSNLWAVHNDPKLWGDPEVFRPERFLNDQGEVIRSEHLVTFSLGKRQCLGIELARMELYLFFTSMLQKFTFKAEEGTDTSLEPKLSIIHVPKYFKARAILRAAAK